MRAHIAAFKAALEGVGLPGHFVDVPDKATVPYALLWTGSGRPPTEDSLEAGSDFEDVLGVTSVADTPEGVLTVQGRARAALTPFLYGSTAVPGRRVWLTLFDSRPVQVDRDVTITATGLHPAYGVDMYRLVSTTF